MLQRGLILQKKKKKCFFWATLERKEKIMLIIIPTNSTNWKVWNTFSYQENWASLSPKELQEEEENVHGKLNALQKDYKTDIVTEIQTHFFNINKQKNIIKHSTWKKLK